MGDCTPSNGFQDPSPPVKQEIAVVKQDDQPILTPGPLGSRRKSKDANSGKRRHQTGNNVVFKEVLQGEQKPTKDVKKIYGKTKSLRI